MTLSFWIPVLLTITGYIGAVFAWLWNERRLLRHREELRSAASKARLDEIERGFKTSQYEVKQELLTKIKDEKDILHERCKQIESEHAIERGEFTAELRSIADTFTRTCEGIQTKLEHLASTIIGQYVPRQEIDARFSRHDEKQDRILSILYDMKK